MLSSLISNMVVSSIKSITKIDNYIDRIILELAEEKEFSQNRVKEIINQKNNIYETINSTEKNIETIDKTSNSIESIIDKLSTATTLITSIPIPTALPGATGIPIGIIMTYADKLNNFKEIISVNKNTLNGAKVAIETISSSLNEIKNKLNNLDIKLKEYIENNLNNLTEEEKITLINELNNQFIIKNKNELIDNINFKYKGFNISIEKEPINKFILFRRRAIGKQINKPYTLITGDYSFTTKVHNLTNNLKIKINKFLKK